MGSMNAIPQTFEFWQDRRMPYGNPKVMFWQNML